MMSELPTFFQAMLSESAPIRCITECAASRAAADFMEEVFALKIKHGTDWRLYGYSSVTDQLCRVFRNRSVLISYYFEPFDFYLIVSNDWQHGYSHLVFHADVTFDMSNNTILKSRYVDVSMDSELDKTLATTLMYVRRNKRISLEVVDKV